MIGPEDGAPWPADGAGARHCYGAGGVSGGWSRRGFSNAKLLGALAFLAVISLLSLIQRGEIDPTAFLAQPTAAPAGTRAAGRRGKPPALIPSAPAAKAVPTPAETVPPVPRYRISPRRELERALGRMDSRSVATLLATLDPDTAVTLLSRLHERVLARILEEAHPADAAQWVDEILTLPESTEQQVPPAAPTAADTAPLAGQGETPAQAGDGADTTAAAAAEQEAGGVASPGAEISSEEETSGSGSESTGSGGAPAYLDPSRPQPETNIA